MMEEHIVPEPVEAPCEQAERRVLEGAEGEAETVLNWKSAEEKTQRANEREAGIRGDGRAVYVPWIVGGNVDDFRVGRRNVDVALVVGHVFLGRGLQIAGL